MLKKIISIYILIFLGTGNLLSQTKVYNLSTIETNGEVSFDTVGYYNDLSLNVNSKSFAKINFKPLVLPKVDIQHGYHYIKVDFYTLDSIHKLNFILPFLINEEQSAYLCNSKDSAIRHLVPEGSNSSLIYAIESLEPGRFSMIYKIKSSFTLFFPLKAMSYIKEQETTKTDELIYAMYFGIVLIMAFYNLFVYFATKLNSYLYYVVFIFAFGVAQFSFTGYLSGYIFVGNLVLAKQFGIIFSGISGVAGILFFNSFLSIKEKLKVVYKVLFGFLILYLVAIFFAVQKWFFSSFNILNFNALISGLIVLFGSLYLSIKGNRPATFFFYAWVVFLVSLILYVFINLGFLPYNSLTKYVLIIGSAIEIALLSFALADKINILSKENETLVREQNIELEKQVKERTAELGDAYDSLKETQTQLVNSEKMASLGHLTAGIAHEINNPINFISANITPLRRDIADYDTMMKLYQELNQENTEAKLQEINEFAKRTDFEYVKKEVQILLSGIDEGARRTAEIVRNLKIFSHIDKSEVNLYQINEGLITTLQLLNHKLTGIKVIENLGNLPMIMCMPGKLNQVFMNLLSNAIDALAGVKNAEITVTSFLNETNIQIEIEDNGHGIPEQHKANILEPFFTTKAVGSGTGLGLSISMSIIKEHHGTLACESEEGKGTKFIVTLPLDFAE